MFYSVQALIHYVKFVMFVASNHYIMLVVKLIRNKFIYFPLLISTRAEIWRHVANTFCTDSFAHPH